jgi:hypothetical protein
MECIIADATATSKIVLWNNNVNKFQVNSSYDVITWSASPYLPTTKVDEFSMKVIDDIGNVQPQVSTSKTLTNCSIIGIKSLTAFHACYSCSSKVLPTSDVLANCIRCSTTQVLTNCVERHAARLDVKSDSGITTVTFVSPLLDELCNSKVSSGTLLLHQPFTMNITNNVAKSFMSSMSFVMFSNKT